MMSEKKHSIWSSRDYVKELIRIKEKNERELLPHRMRVHQVLGEMQTEDCRKLDKKGRPVCSFCYAADEALKTFDPSKLGWVKAEPTDCRKCRDFEDCSEAGAELGGENFICLDFQPRDKVGELDSESQTRTGKQEDRTKEPIVVKGSPAQIKPHGLRVIDGSPSSIAKWLREQEGEGR